MDLLYFRSINALLLKWVSGAGSKFCIWGNPLFPYAKGRLPAWSKELTVTSRSKSVALQIFPKDFLKFFTAADRLPLEGGSCQGACTVTEGVDPYGLILFLKRK